MNREETDENDIERDNQSDRSECYRPRAFQIIEERMEKRRRRASFGKLISYIVVLILAILLMLYLRRLGL